MEPSMGDLIGDIGLRTSHHPAAKTASDAPFAFEKHVAASLATLSQPRMSMKQSCRTIVWLSSGDDKFCPLRRLATKGATNPFFKCEDCNHL